MQRLKTTATLSALLATMASAGLLFTISTASTASAGTDFAEASYNDGMELLAKGDAYRAIAKFEYAITSARRNKRTPKPKYFLKNCQAHVRALDEFRLDQWKDLIEVCESAVKNASPSTADDASRFRKQMKEALAKRAAASAKTASTENDHAEAAGFYEIAVKLDPRASYRHGLCTALSNAGSAKAAASCARAAKDLKGEARREATRRASQAGDKPDARQREAIEAIEGVIWKVTGSSDASDANECMSLVKKARAVRVKGHFRVKVDDEFPEATEVANPGRGASYYAPFEKIAPVCRAVLGEGLAQPLARALAGAQYWIDAAAKATDENDFATTSFTVAECRAAIKTALEAGIDPKAPIDVEGREVRVEDADAKVCTALEDVAARKVKAFRAAAEAERAAKLAPYKKVLRADKWKLYEKVGVDTWFQGRGGALLKTPAQLVKAKKWFITSVGRDPRTHRKTWRLTIYVFRGDKLRKTDVKTGRGGEPPSKAFR